MRPARRAGLIFWRMDPAAAFSAQWVGYEILTWDEVGFRPYASAAAMLASTAMAKTHSSLPRNFMTSLVAVKSNIVVSIE
jgi:hypothetical protein